MIPSTKLCWLTFWGAFSIIQCGHSSPYEKLIAGHKVKARIGSAPSGKRLVLIDGQPHPLFWANLTGGGDDYRRAGFNTLMPELGYPGKDISLEEAFAGWDQQLLDIKEQGLYAVVYIHNSIHAQAEEAPSTFDDKWCRYVQAIVSRYRPMTNLVGWVFSDEYGDALSYPDEAFRAFLRQKYHTIEALNAVWKSHHASFDDIRLEYQREGRGRPEGSMVQQEFPFGIGPKAFDSARFKIEHTAWANRQFEQAVREVDPLTPIWSGANNLGWAAAQIPETWGAFFDFYPENSGNDMLTHHIWAMDIGRGPNARPAMQMLLPEHFSHYNWHLDARVFRGWMVESAIHGADGITVWPWSFLGVDNRPGDRSSNVERIDTVGVTIRQLEASGIFAMMPTPTIAILYQPYTEGWGALSQVYGLLRYPSDEPVVLMRELRFGTKYGQVEYLTNNTLDKARFDAYGVVLAQFSCDLTAENLRLLREYVENGGVLFADIGFDCMRGGKTITSMTEEAKQLFGVQSLTVSKAPPGSFVATGEFSELLGGLVKGEDKTERLRHYPLDVDATTAIAALQGPGKQGLYVNRVGKGYALFCSVLAWKENIVTDPLRRKIHQALFSRRARIERVDEEDWSKMERDVFFTQGYEIARFKNGYVMQNRTQNDLTMHIRVGQQVHEHTLPPYRVLLVKDGEQIPLGSGLWPVETGPASP